MIPNAKPVGAGLLAKAVCQPASMSDVPAPSPASQLPQVMWPAQTSRLTPAPAREGGMSASINVECEGPFAGKPAPTGHMASPDITTHPGPCGSEPAREGGVSASINVECESPFAGKPAPTGHVASPDITTHPGPCGSEPAREGGVSASINVEGDGPFASKPAPTGLQE